MKLVIVTGMSGAGKTIALKMLEDMRFYCVDNLPIPLADKFIQLAAGGRGIDQAALGIDIRGGEELEALDSILKGWRERELDFKVLFLDASDEALIKRYKETRRSHPLAGRGRVDQGIAKERERLAFLRRDADYIIDTSRLLTRELRQELEKIFIKNQAFRSMFITVLSFGFKYGIPQDGDLVFDVRFMPNPFYIDALRGCTGLDPEVRDYVFSFKETGEFMDKLRDLLRFVLPLYREEGKTVLVVAVGCTGGHHRSVAVIHALAEFIASLGYRVTENHRDMTRM